MGDVTQTVRLQAWTQADLSLLRQANTPEMTAHLGGPESQDKLLDRHRRYLPPEDPRAGQMFAVVLQDGQRVGIIGYWERSWHDESAYETGWSVVPAFQLEL
jgi:RimJ/RimL family protein N-acetyltransferase